MAPDTFFLLPSTVAQKQYEALRMFFIDKQPALMVAQHFGYTYRGFTTIVANFRKDLKAPDTSQLFFTDKKKGRKRTDLMDTTKDIIIGLRKKYLSVEDIKVALDGKGYKLSEKSIYNIISEDGFAKLPRRMKALKQQIEIPRLNASKSEMLAFSNEEFKSASGGILCFLPFLEKYGISKIIRSSAYPETKTISRLNSILSFIALKLFERQALFGR